MSLGIVFQAIEPTNRNVVWLHPAHITTAQGHTAYYDIAEDGAVTVNNDHVSSDSIYGKYLALGGNKS